MTIAKVSKKGWIVIPKETRDRYGIKPGDDVVVLDYGRGITIVPALKDPIRQSRGMLKSGKSMKEFLEEKRAELEEEERGLPPPKPRS